MDETHLNYLKSIHMQSRGYVYLLVSAPKKKKKKKRKIYSYTNRTIQSILCYSTAVNS